MKRTTVLRSQRLILASASPRRAELLRQHGYAFEVVLSPEAEPTEFPPHTSPVQRAEFLSRFKAAKVADLVRSRRRENAPPDSQAQPNALVLGADTIAALGNEVFGKPADRADARRILSSIAGTVHHVITGVTLIDVATRASVTFHDITAVHMRALRDDELEAYLDSNAWEGKAGAYGIQDYGDRFVTRIEGSFSNVVGLPMERVSQSLASWRKGSA